MKRFFGLSLLAILIFTASIFFMTGCAGIFGNVEGELSSSGNTVDKNHEHSFGAWEVEKAATCVSSGTERRICSICNQSESRMLEITGNHDFKSDVCTLCGYVSGLDDYFTFTLLSDGTYSVTAKKYVPKNIVIPREYNGVAVTVIGSSAFGGCNFIENVEIPDSIARIETAAFNGCSALEKIIIPKSVIQIEDGAFSNCTASLQSITVKDGNPSYHSDGNCLIETATNTLMLGCESSMIPSYVTKIGSCAFFGCTGIDEITLHEGITEIGNSAFRGCSNLVSVSLPQSVTAIGLHAFRDCSSLTAFSIPNGVRSIEQDTFSGCSSLESLYIPKSVVSIQANNPFRGCAQSLISIEVDQDNINYSSDGNCLINKKEKSVILGCKNSVIPDYVTRIAAGAFLNCTGLEELTLPSGINAIGVSAFENCKGLKSITLPESLREIKGYTFNQCSSLESVEIPGGINSIGNYAFYGCKSLKTPVLPDTVSGIDRFAFGECTNLLSFTFPKSITFVGDDAFTNCLNICTVTVSKKEHFKYLNSNVFGNCEKIVELYNLSGANISIGEDGYGSIIRDDVKFIHTSKEEESVVKHVADFLFFSLDDAHYLLGYTGRENELTLPDDYNGFSYHIYQSAFKCKEDLTKVVLSDGVITVGIRAFMDCCNLISITLNANLTSIKYAAFSGCARLSEVYNPSNASIESIIPGKITHKSLSEESAITRDGDFLFIAVNGENQLLGYTGELSDIRLPSSFKGGSYAISSYAFYKNDQIKRVTIPSGVSAIGQGAFMYCENLESVIFEDGNTITEISYQAFTSCTSLASISLPNSVVKIDYQAFFGCSALRSIDLSQNLTDIDSTAFDLCDGVINQYKSFRYIGVGDNPYYILLGAKNRYSTSYQDSDITSCDIFYRTRIIAGCAFSDCKKLERITLNNGLIGIGSYAFSGCVLLESLSLPGTITSVGDGAFSECIKLKDIDFSDRLTHIGKRAFNSCSSLTSITIPKSVTFIGNDAFSGCSRLMEIYNLSNVVLNGNHGVFCVVHTSESEESVITRIGDFLFVTLDGKNYLLEYCGDQTDIVLPTAYNGLKYEIISRAFYGRSDITSVVISSGVSSIGYDAFGQCANLSKVTIGSTVNFIEQHAFSGSYNLTEAVFEDPSGWRYDEVMKFSEKDLVDISIAASYLRSEHAGSEWQKR